VDATVEMVRPSSIHNQFQYGSAEGTAMVPYCAASCGVDIVFTHQHIYFLTYVKRIRRIPQKYESIRARKLHWRARRNSTCACLARIDEFA